MPYAATAAVSHLEDYRKKLLRAAKVRGFRYLHVLTPCPISWGYPHRETMEVTEAAVETGMWMLYEIEDGRLRITRRIEPENRLPVEEYLNLQGRFKHLKAKPEEIQKIQEHIDSEWQRLEKIESSGIEF